MDCLGCASFAVVASGECVAECPAGTTFTRGSECLPCHPECLDGGGCSGPSAAECNECQNFALESGGSTVCVGSCPGRFYQDMANRQCSTCNDACLTCNGNGTMLEPGGCDSCAVFSWEHHPRGNTTTASNVSECVLTCPLGTYGDPQSRACLACDDECSAPSGCFGPGPSACGDPSRTPTAVDCAHAIRGRTCVASCNATNEFLQSPTNPVCVSCHAECEGGCSGPDPSQCTTCKTARFGRTCVAQCPLGMVVADPIQRVCVDCHSECLRNASIGAPPTCNGTTFSDCDTCAHYARRGACVPGCNTATEFFGGSSGRECLACHSSCSSTAGCTGPMATDCRACRCV